MTASVVQQSLFAPADVGAISAGARDSTLGPLVCPESFRLAADHRAIERIIRLRSGSSYTTRTSLSKGLQKGLLSEPKLASQADALFLRTKAWPFVDPAAPTVRLVDLFSGCGIMTLGVWEACRAIGRRLQPVLAVDVDPTALRVYKQNFPEARVSGRLIEEFLDGGLGEKPTEVERKLKSDHVSVDILVGGPPCQGHSDLNNYTRRSDPKNRLYERMARYAELFGPTHVLIENVPTVLHDRGRIVDKTAAALTRLGYSVDHTVAEISSLGIAQRRRRHALVASLTSGPDLKRSLSLYERGPRTAKWAIGDLSNLAGDTPFDKASVPSKLNQRRIDYLFRTNRHELPDRMRPDCHRLKNHTYKSVYGRMYWDEPAQTITSGFTCMGQGRYVHPKEKRTLTPHEAARLQFIPDFFRFDESIRRTALAEMIGNAVPTKLTYVLALELLR